MIGHAVGCASRREKGRPVRAETMTIIPIRNRDWRC